MVNQIPKHIHGLDSIRFWAALWVVFGHGNEFPLMTGIDKNTQVGWLLNGIYNNFFSGPSAVIVFFVISGFVINYPYVNNKPFSLSEFYIRRFVRVVVPVLVAIGLSISLDVNLSLFKNSILWSLIAELIYYLMYPLIRILIRYVKLSKLVVYSLILSYVVVLTNPGAGDYPSYGTSMNWLLGLPCWLLGCKLAEINLETKPKLLDHLNISTVRVLIFSLSVVFSILRFHSPLGYPWTLNIFSIAVFFWLACEIHNVNYGSKMCNTRYELLGLFSYSLYLTHPLAMKIWSTLYIPNLGYIINWTMQILFIIVFSYLFYVAIEKPSHFLARKLSRI
jgi:peptidoglycan/LPS O-acetylase OafA/YrhL